MRVDQAFIPGRSRENARKVLAAAKKAGVSVREVRTTDGGYMVPAAVADTYSGKRSRSKNAKSSKETDNG